MTESTEDKVQARHVDAARRRAARRDLSGGPLPPATATPEYACDCAACRLAAKASATPGGAR